MQVSEQNGVKVYNLSTGKSSFQWEQEALKQSLRYNQEFKQRIEVIQDLEFPQYIGATGMYPPSFKLFDTKELSLKHSRGLEAEVVQFQFLTEDYKKIALLGADRSIELHAQYGKHFKTRIPTFGRDLAYCSITADLVAVGSHSEIYRLNLEQGRFLESIDGQMDEMNCCCVNPYLKKLLCVGGNAGLQIIDITNTKQRITLQGDTNVTSVNFNSEGQQIAVGDTQGCINIYDIRYQKPFQTLKHQYRIPIIRSI